MNYVTITTRKYVPIILYVNFPCMSIFIMFCMLVAFPEMIRTNNISVEILHRLHLFLNHPFVSSSNRKLLIKERRALQRLRINIGLFEYVLFYFKTSTKVTLLYTIVSYTISALLGYPNSKLAEAYRVFLENQANTK